MMVAAYDGLSHGLGPECIWTIQVYFIYTLGSRKLQWLAPCFTPLAELPRQCPDATLLFIEHLLCTSFSHSRSIIAIRMSFSLALIFLTMWVGGIRTSTLAFRGCVQMLSVFGTLLYRVLETALSIKQHPGISYSGGISIAALCGLQQTGIYGVLRKADAGVVRRP